MKKEDDFIESVYVQDFNGTSVDLLNKFEGQPLLLIIYNNQCLGCTGRAIPMAYDFSKQYEDLVVVGIHSEFGNHISTEEEIRSIFTIDELPFPIFIDPKKKIYDQFSSEGTPQWILITKDHKLYRSIFGSQGGAANRLMYALDDLCS